MALTPVAAMMFRYNNPDALLALLLTGATYATMRGLERAQTKWLVLAGALVGFGFITKMMQAFLILPVMAVVYLLAAPTGWWRRVWQVVLMGVSVLVAAGWWVAAVALTPAADRPYVGGSQNNSILNLIFGYNGFGRIDGQRERQRRRRRRVAGSMWGPTGLTRLFNAEFGNMMSWLLPGALVMGAVLLVVTLRARRTDRERAALLLWGGSLVEHRAHHQPGAGHHPPLLHGGPGPAAGALVGIATFGLWQRRASWVGRLGLAGRPGRDGRLELRAPRPHLRLVPAPAFLRGCRAARSGWSPSWRCPLLRTIPKLAVALVAALGLGAALAAPSSRPWPRRPPPHNGAIPSVTPTPAGGQGGPGGGFPGGGGGFAGRWGASGLRRRRLPAVAAPAGRRFPGGGRRFPRWRHASGRRQAPARVPADSRALHLRSAPGRLPSRRAGPAVAVAGS